MKTNSILFILTFLLFFQSCQISVDEKCLDEKNKLDPLQNQSDILGLTHEKMESSSTLEIEYLPKNSKISHPEAVGIWRVPKEKAHLQGDNPDGSTWAAMPWPPAFKYDGVYLTLLFLVLESPLSSAYQYPKSEDGYYKLKASWHEDSLFYLSPFNQATFLAIYNNKQFSRTELYEKSTWQTWEYDLLTEKEVSEYSKPLLKQRAVYEYQ